MLSLDFWVVEQAVVRVQGSDPLAEEDLEAPGRPWSLGLSRRSICPGSKASVSNEKRSCSLAELMAASLSSTRSP